MSFLSTVIQCWPGLAPGVEGILKSSTMPVRGSSLEMYEVRWLLNQILPRESETGSCGAVNRRGNSYSVMTTLVAGPRGPGRGWESMALAFRPATLGGPLTIA